jgi:ribosomal protein S18 acetylase RimI-like enzyme
MKVSEASLLDRQLFPKAADVLERAFYDYPFMEYCVPAAKGRQRAVSSLYSSVLHYSLRYGEVYATSETEGLACWLPPEAPFPSLWRMARAGMLALPLRFGWTGFRRLQAVDNVAEHLHREHAPGAHWYLWVIGVDPKFQGQGVAGQLMKPVFDRADRDQYRCYLETHKESNVRVYERHGFHVVSKTPVPGHPLTVWAMIRSPGVLQPSLA